MSTVSEQYLKRRQTPVVQWNRESKQNFETHNLAIKTKQKT